MFRLFLLGTILLASPHMIAQEALHRFEIQEYLSRDWTNEMAVLPLNELLDGDAQHLVNPDGQPQPSQAVMVDGKPHLAFMVDLPADALLTYDLMPGAKALPNSFHVEHGDVGVRIFNERTGIALPTTLEEARKGPIQGIRMASGRWVGSSSLAIDGEIEAYRLEVLAQGPVFTDVLAVYTLADATTWSLRYRLIAGEGVVRIEERWSPTPSGAWRLQLDRELAPDTILWRNSSHQVQPRNGLMARRIDQTEGTVLTLYPWLPWWMERAGSFTALFQAGEDVTYLSESEGLLRQVAPKPGQQERPDAAELLGEKRPPDGDVLYLATARGGDWANPGEDGVRHGLPVRANKQGGAWVDLRFAGPGRTWLIGASTMDRTIVPNTQLPEPQESLIRHLETPLQEVLEMDLAWEQNFDEQAFPRLFFGRDDVDRVKAWYAEQGTQPTLEDSRQKLLWQALVEGSAEAGESIANQAMLNTWVFTDHVEHGDLAAGTAVRRPSAPAYNHHVTMGMIRRLIWIDAALACGTLSLEQRQKLQARLAFFTYKMASPHFYDLSRNYRANPNMTTARHAVVGLLACLLDGHPQSRAWNELGEQEIRRQLQEWVGPNGGWLECPHYQTILADAICFLQAAHRVGYSDLALDDRLLKTILYLAKISTPPDPRSGGRRHLPPAGNTYRYESSMIFSVLAHMHREANPDEARALQWLWQEQGRPMFMGIGGDNVYNAFSEFAIARFDVDTPPQWGSEVFPYSGTILSHGFPSKRETQLYMLHGPFDQHYDHDRGAISFWGLGQPLMLDWGYDGRMPADMHTMMGGGNRGRVSGHAFQPKLDYLDTNFGAWRRQILFVKTPGEQAPAIALIRDATIGERPLPWYAWFYTDVPVQRPGQSQVVHMTGQADVDLDIWFSGKWAGSFPRMTWKEVEQDKPPAAPDTALKADNTLGDDEAEDFLAGTEPPPPPHLKMRDGAATVVEGYTGRHGWAYGAMRQRGLSLTVPPGRPVSWLLYPRLKDTASPTMTELADGKGVSIVSGDERHILFLGDEPFTFRQGDIRFEGTAGAIHLRGKQVTLTLAAPGTIAWKAAELKADAPATQSHTMQ